MTNLANTQRIVSWHVHAQVDNIHMHKSISELADIQLSAARPL
uniref:Putative E3 ubiquitin-protein ligase ARI8 n=1 Tax=Rhizophora mucronata TaxID=61149 RepID=A0A2P2LQM4_RHIMU